MIARAVCGRLVRLGSLGALVILVFLALLSGQATTNGSGLPAKVLKLLQYLAYALAWLGLVLSKNEVPATHWPKQRPGWAPIPQVICEIVLGVVGVAAVIPFLREEIASGEMLAPHAPRWIFLLVIPLGWVAYILRRAAASPASLESRVTSMVVAGNLAAGVLVLGSPWWVMVPLLLVALHAGCGTPLILMSLATALAANAGSFNATLFHSFGNVVLHNLLPVIPLALWAGQLMLASGLLERLPAARRSIFAPLAAATLSGCRDSGSGERTGCLDGAASALGLLLWPSPLWLLLAALIQFSLRTIAPAALGALLMLLPWCFMLKAQPGTEVATNGKLRAAARLADFGFLALWFVTPWLTDFSPACSASLLVIYALIRYACVAGSARAVWHGASEAARRAIALAAPITLSIILAEVVLTAVQQNSWASQIPRLPGGAASYLLAGALLLAVLDWPLALVLAAVLWRLG